MEVENSPLEDCSTLQPNSFLLLVARPGAPFVASLLLETGGGPFSTSMLVSPSVAVPQTLEVG